MAAVLRHFIFSGSAAGSLKQALKLAGRRERVFCWADNLSFGPIDPPDPAARLVWIERELMIDLGKHAREIKRLNDFWNAAEASRRRLVWFSRRDAGEYADFLEWVWRMGDAAYDVVEFDEANVTFNRADGPTTQAKVNNLALLRPEHLATARYWDSAKPLDVAARDRHRATWAELRRENASLRVLDGGRLVSAPFSYFDDLIISCVPAGWTKVNRVIGDAIGKLFDEPFRQTGAWVLRARVLKMAEADRLDIRGDQSLFGGGEVRLPASNGE
ncbi:MAG TPA: DUF3658 domain-containing protein [Stellaceae bacterium]|jgi:hypothetical protein|nr:DUF3658 domain-containing protein [Stellaceae bacterium]